jgi:hypothetical protein
VFWVRLELYGLHGNQNRRIEGGREEFIDALTHDSIVVQIPYLKKRWPTDLENLLSIFDQSQVICENHQMLSLPTGEMQKGYAEERRLKEEALAELERLRSDLRKRAEEAESGE